MTKKIFLLDVRTRKDRRQTSACFDMTFDMTIAPAGVMPPHDHGDRPALIVFSSGEIDENCSKCLVPILHKAGDIASEHAGTKHHWKNEANQPVELAAADIVNDAKPAPIPKHL